MSSTTNCDKCKKKQTGKDEKKWSSLNIRTRLFGGLEIEGLDKNSDSYDMCPKCGKIILEQIVKILGKK